MVLEDSIKDLILHLLHHKQVQIPVNGSDIQVSLAPADEALSMDTLVYQGSNYLPKSVREATLSHAQGPRSQLATTLSLDEETFQVFLRYNGSTSELQKGSFIRLLEEFSWLAEEWRLFLDDQDKRDLVHVYAN